MKKIIAALTVIFSLTTSAYAYDGSGVSKSLLQTFNEKFSGASNVSWAQVSNELYRFSFNYKGKNAQAFFSEGGNLVATGSVIAADHLPMIVSKAIDESYAGYEKTESIEFTMDGETKYLVTVSNGQRTEILKVSNDGDINVVKKSK